MSLKFWLGPSGSGKSTKLYNYLIGESIKHPEQNYYIIVPEQANLQTQQELVRLHPRGGILNMDVLSFNRLAHRIFEETGYGSDGGRVIDDMGKNLVLRRVSQLHKDELPLLGDNLYKLGYITSVKSLISEFMQYGISPEKSRKMADTAEEAGRGALALKLKDVSLLYEEFLSLLKDRYTTREELMIRLSKNLKESKKIRNTVIAFDGFTGFTPVQLEVIEQLLILCPGVHVALDLDKRDGNDDIKIEEHELFYLSRHTISQLGKLADKCHVVIEDSDVVSDDIPVRFSQDDDVSNKMLSFLERNIFREKPGKMRGPSSSEGKECISVTETLTREDELENVAVKINELIREKDYRYKDIAIITGDIELYRSSIERSLSKHGIPYFTDKTQPVLLNPMIEFLRAGIQILSSNYSYESVFRFLRSNLTDINREDIDLFENYCLSTGVNGRGAYHKPFSMLPSYYRHLDPDVKANYLLKINDIRLHAVSLFDALESDICENFNAGVKASVRTFSTAFCGLLSKCNVGIKLNERSEKLSDEGMDTKAKAYDQIYERVMGVFEQMVELLGDEKLTVKEFGQLLDAGLDEIRIGVIPKTNDYVQVGDLTRSRVGKIKALFLVGANDGVIPQGVSAGGLLSDDDKNFFTGVDDKIAFAPTARENAYTQRLYMYMMLTKPSEILDISYSKINQSGESMRPSSLIRTVRNIFPDLKITAAGRDLGSRISDRKGSFSLIAENIKRYLDINEEGTDENDDSEFIKQFESLVEYYSNEENYKERLLNLLNAAKTEPSTAISKAVAAALYGHRMYSSITKLEKYASCAYEYFLQYGLKLKEREEFDFAASNLGNVFHSALEVYTNKLKEKGISWDDITEDEMSMIMNEAVDFAVASDDAAALYATKRSAYMVNRIKRIMLRTARVLKYQAGKGMFKPYSVEVDFNSIENLDALNLKLSDEDSIRLSGRIDRIDTCKEGDTTYVRVIDYKSGNLSLDIDAVYEGRQLQLVVYMDTALELLNRTSDGKSVPAGILYYHIDDPVITPKDSADISKIEEQIRDKLKMTGYVNSDRHIIDLMDDDFTKGSDVIPVSKNADNSISAKSKVLSTEEFNDLSVGARKAMTELGIKMLNGDIYTAKETKEAIKHANTCKYCDYKSVCKQRTGVIENDEADENRETDDE